MTMPRPVTDRVKEIRRQLVERICNNAHQPGDRFLSNRAIADQFHISYQTADRIVRTLVNDGLLVRRSAAGTFIPGEASPLIGAILLFDRRGKRKASFGDRLFSRLTAALDRLHIDWRIRWIDPANHLSTRIPTDRIPVLWNLPHLLKPLLDQKRRAVLLNDRAPSGVHATVVDSIEVDDFSGGACAAQCLIRRTAIPHGTTSSQSTKTRQFAIVTGPSNDPRSLLRVQGFLSLAPAKLIHSGGWFYEHAQHIAHKAIASGRDGIFCCNDRLAHALVDYARENALKLPPIVGFDNAPIAEQLGLTTIAIPWMELTHAAARLIRGRLRDHRSTASHRVFAPHPVERGWRTVNPTP